jgi:hypothetical protein
MGSTSTAHWILLSAVLWTLPLWFVTKKAGRPPILSLLNLIPGVVIIYLYWLAFSRWPDRDQARVETGTDSIDARLDEARQQAAEHLRRFGAP